MKKFFSEFNKLMSWNGQLEALKLWLISLYADIGTKMSRRSLEKGKDNMLKSYLKNRAHLIS